jgi:flagellar export protein FliJ
MRPFKFRPQVALDLRQRRDEAAQRELAAANAAASAAEADLDHSLAAKAQAQARAAADHARATGVESLVWHRNWIAAQQRDVLRRRAALERRRADADAARERATRTHIDVRVLEKVKDRAWRAYNVEAGRAEQRDMDWLAVLRATARDDGSKETG